MHAATEVLAAGCEEGATTQHLDAPSAQPEPADPGAAEAAPLRPPAPLIARAPAPAGPAPELDPLSIAPYADLPAAMPVDEGDEEPPASAPRDAGQRRRHLIVAALASGVGAAALVASATAGELISITSLAGVLFLSVAGARYSLARNA